MDTEIQLVELGGRLFQACQAGQADEVPGFLAEAPEDRRAELVNSQERGGRLTCVIIAAACGHAEVVEHLIKVPGIDCNLASEGQAFTPLLISVISGHIKVVQLVAPLSDVNKTCQTPGQFNSPLIWAVFKGHLEILKYLASLPDVDINLKNGLGGGAIHFAAAMRNIPMFELLLEHPRIDLNSLGPNGFDLLATSVMTDNTTIVSKVLELKVGDINAKSETDGVPLLMTAVRNPVSPEVIKLLLAQPSLDVGQVDSAGKTALDLAIELKKFAIVDLLREALGKTLTPEEAEAEATERIDVIVGCNHSSRPGTKDIPALKALLEQWAGNAAVLNGGSGPHFFSPFYNACRDGSFGSLEALQALAATEGVDVNFTDPAGFSGLMQAAKNFEESTVDFLLTLPTINLTLRDVKCHKSAAGWAGRDTIQQAIIAKMTPEQIASEAKMDADIAGGKEILAAVKADDVAALMALCQKWSGNETALNLGDEEDTLVAFDNKSSKFGVIVPNPWIYGCKSPLMRCKSVEALRVLLATPGVHVNARDLESKTALQHFLYRLDLLEVLLAAPGLDFGVRDGKVVGKTVLEPEPVSDRNSDDADDLLFFTKVKPMLCAAMGVSELSTEEAAAEKRSLDTINAGREVLAAVEKSDTLSLKELLSRHGENAAVVNYQLKRSRPLILAVEKGSLECVKLLTACASVDVNADVKNVFKLYCSALMKAANGKNPEIFLHLLSLPTMNVELNEEAEGKRVADVCRLEIVMDAWRSFSGVELEGRDKAVSANTKLFQAVDLDESKKIFDLPVLQSIVDQWKDDAEWRDVVFGVPPGYIKELGTIERTPIYQATETRQMEALKLLASVPGQHVNMQCPYKPPLGVAVGRNDVEAVEILLAAPGIDLNIRPMYGELPLFEQASTIEMKSLLRAKAGIVLTAEELEQEAAQSSSLAMAPCL